MPQLDKVTYFSQVVWLAIIFVVLYYNISLNYLPRLAYVLKGRTIHLNKNESGVKFADCEISQLVADTRPSTDYSGHVRIYYGLVNTQVSNWTKEWLAELASDDLVETNQIAIETQALLPAFQQLKDTLFETEDTQSA